jgi:hypothetical protein
VTEPDPFGTRGLRDSVLMAWKSSPTRLREDAATEADLVRGGYRDRVLTELAQNAADAAASAGAPGRLAVWQSGDRLHLANTGVPLDTLGVQSLSALRASAKPESDGAADQSVGRFGVGFTAVLSVSEEIEVRSRTGSVRFSAADTRAALSAAGIEATVDPAVLRLVWPATDGPAAGWDTEVVLRLRESVDAAALLASMRADAIDLLLELPALESISVDGTDYVRTVTQLSNGIVELAIGPRRWWQYRTGQARWLLPCADSGPTQAGPDVLRAPTRSDEELSVPALIVADIPMQPDRRRVLPGHTANALVAGYADFARALPEAHRLLLVPAVAFPRSEFDARLREALLDELRGQPWLPVRDGDCVPTRAVVLPGLTDELAALLADVVPDLVIPQLSGSVACDVLGRLDVTRIGLVRLAEMLSGIDRPAHWWSELYVALEPLVADPLAVEELGALPVPLSDRRLVTGPRTVMLTDLADSVSVGWARVAHPDAVAPLLERLGARRATAVDLLCDPALRDEIADGDDDLADAVLRLAGRVGDWDALPDWLGELQLPDQDGVARRADELLLPGSPLAGLLVDDAPFGTVGPALVAEYGAEALRAVGVGWGFSVVTEADPTGPDHDLDDEDRWWDQLDDDPPVLSAVRDLDLVDDTRWAAALTELATDSATAVLLTDRDGYTAWWLRAHARIGGVPLGMLRSRDDPTFDGLLEVFEHPGADVLRALTADPDNLDTAVVQALVDALADPRRTPTPAVIAETHRLLAAARVDSDDVALPSAVRAISGAVADSGYALVLDLPWYAQVLDPDRLVVGDLEGAGRLARLLDLPLASEAVDARVLGEGRRTSWEREPFAVLIGTVLDLPSAGGELVVHETLEVCLTGAVEATVQVPWWVDGKTTHFGPKIGILPR